MTSRKEKVKIIRFHKNIIRFDTNSAVSNATFMEDNSRSITYNLAQFKIKKNVRFLARAIMLILVQGRIPELAYGTYCGLVYSPSPVKNRSFDLTKHLDESVKQPEVYISREQLIASYGAEFDVRSLPEDFAAGTHQSMAHSADCLVVGEYAIDSARVAYITRNSCEVTDFYNQISGVRHIHLIIESEEPGKYLISTGDTRKFLDLWSVDEDGKFNFVKRLKKRFAGYTAAIVVGGRYYFGTDFSNRPNYILTLDGNKYFFPKPAYRQFVVTFYSILDRYIVSINSDMPQLGGRKSLSIFDTLEEEFVFCDWLDQL